MRRLRAGGRAGVVVPMGVLTSNAGAAVWIRRELLEGNQIQAVVELPGGVFKPYTGVKTGLIFWTNDAPDDDFLVIRVENDGYSLDDRRDPIDGSDLPGALELLAGRASSVPHARVSRSDVARNGYNLSPSRYISGASDMVCGLDQPDLPKSLAAAKQALADVEGELKRIGSLL